MTETKNQTLHAWIAAEHARLHLVAEWPESARKDTLLKAIRSSIQRLTSDEDVASFTCVTCRVARAVVVLSPSPVLRPVTSIHGMAA